MTGPRATGPRGLDPDELDTTDQADLADALESEGWLEAAIGDVPVAPGPSFTNRVMAALAAEPTPAPVGFLTPLRRLGLLAGFGASVRQAWASIGAPGRPTFARATALAYVLVIAIAGTSLAGAATIGLAGAIGILGPQATEASPSNVPFESSQPGTTEQPSAESEPPGTEAPGEPGDTPGASDDHGGSGGPEPSDDHGSTSGPGSSGGTDEGSGGGGSGSPTSSPDGGGSSDDGGASATSTPKPSQAPRSTDSPKPSQTSGSGGGSGSSN
jgi:uncharacterized membrane protein YgcG